MRKVVAYFVPLAVIVWASLCVGCGPKYPNCETDEHCKEHNEFCVDKLCRECRDSGNCVDKTGDKCKICSAGYICVKDASCCHNDLDCPGGKCWKNEGDEVGQCGPKCKDNTHCEEGQECIGGNCVAKPKAPCEGVTCGNAKKCVEGRCVWVCDLQNIYFDFNESVLTTEARKLLDQNVECLKTIGAPVMIEGNCDERGTDEYNLALGERRSQSAKKYLKNKGIKQEMKTKSLGEDNPVCTESAESCWWRNRRDEFKPIE